MTPYLIAGYAIPLVLFSAYRIWMTLKRRALERELERYGGKVE